MKTVIRSAMDKKPFEWFDTRSCKYTDSVQLILTKLLIDLPLCVVDAWHHDMYASKFV